MFAKTNFYLLLLVTILISSCGVKTDRGTGTVNGKLCYPSDYIPQMKIYLKCKTLDKAFSLITSEDQRVFEFKEIPDGFYTAYAYTIDETITDVKGKSSKGEGGYTNAVPCGLSVKCNDHNLIEFEVKSGGIVEGVDICDWYGAIVPKE